MSDYNVKSLYDLWNSRGIYQKSDYEKFQEWLDNCPVIIKEYDDYTEKTHGEYGGNIQVIFQI